MMTERRHRVTYTMKEVVAALKAARPNCLYTQAIPVDVSIQGPPATMGLPVPTAIDFIWHRLGVAEIVP